MLQKSTLVMNLKPYIDIFLRKNEASDQVRKRVANISDCLKKKPSPKFKVFV